MYALTMTVLLSVMLLFGQISKVNASEIIEITESERQECQWLVEKFCQAWMNRQYEAMYQALSKKGMGKMDKNKFIKTYKGYEAEGGRLVEYTFEDVVTKEDNVLVKVKLKFQKEIPPRIISGSHTFHMERDESIWKIRYMMPPIKAPVPLTLPGGSRPGEQLQ